MSAKMVLTFVCPSECKRKRGQKIVSKKLGYKKAMRIFGVKNRRSVLVLATAEGGYFNEWYCPICGKKLEKAMRKRVPMPSAKVMSKIAKKQAQQKRANRW